MEANSPYMQDGGRLQFGYHSGQREAMAAEERFILLLAGVQSGKTVFGPWWMLREIKRRGPGDYLVAAPTFKLLNLKCLRKLIARDGGSKWVATDAGDIEVHGRPLQDGWYESIVGHDDETLAGFGDVYLRESERCFEYVDEMLGVAFDGSTIYIESQDPWFGWDSIADDLGVDGEEFKHEIRPAIASGRPRGPRILDTTMSAEYSVSVEFAPEVSD